MYRSTINTIQLEKTLERQLK